MRDVFAHVALLTFVIPSGVPMLRDEIEESLPFPPKWICIARKEEISSR